MESPDLRKTADEFISVGSTEAAARCLSELWRRERSPGAASFVVSRWETFRDRLAQQRWRLALLRSFTVEPIVPLLRAAAFTWGVDLNVHCGDFNAYAQELLDEDSSLYRFHPHTVILAVQTSDIAPELWREVADLSADERAAIVARVVSSFRDWVRVFRQHSQASLIIHALEQAALPSQGVMDAQGTGQSAAIQDINRQLCSLAGDVQGVYILDYDALVARHGRLHWHDGRKWLTVRMPIASGHLIHVADEWLRFLLPLTGRVAKVLVADLDNVLWGGVIGEDGMDGIQVGLEYPGASYTAVQRAMLDLSRRGILLAICSKNNAEDAMEVLKHHPGMLLRPEHFAALRINWNDKAQNLREIAAQLNIGTDALAFIDDNPAERQQIRAQLPEVTVIELPHDPMGYASALRECPVFERLSLSDEDRQRRRYYSQQRIRTEAEQGFSSKEDFLRSLEQEAEIAPVLPVTLSRVAQLTQKTNQFNLTNRRYSEQQIAELYSRPGWGVLSLRVRDRYGDNGLVGVVIIHDTDEASEIDSFLLSCRVIGRTLETALLAYLVQEARTKQKCRVQGWFLPTKKNIPARDFYARHGFRLEREEGEGSLWTLDLSCASLACPEWIKLTVPEGGTD